MKAYRLSYKADEIWDYSRDQWGARRGVAYLRDIRTAIELVAERPDIGSELEDPTPYRRRLVGSHMILYRLQDNLVMVVRVLHQSMDVAEALLD